jgi:hypothetical protein
LTCGAPGSGGPFTSPTVISGTAQPPGIAGGFCYLYKLTGTDNVGNTASISSTVIVTPDTFSFNAVATQTAGTAFTVTITAKSGAATDTSYNGTKCITFSGPGNSPNGSAPIYPAQGGCAAGQSSVTFSSGVASAGNAPSITLFAATSSTTLTATDGTITGSASFAVNSAGVTLSFNPSGSITFSKGQMQTFAVNVPNDAYGNTFRNGAGLTVNLNLSSTAHFSLSTPSLTITTGPANNTFTVTENGNNQGSAVTLSATVAAPFTAPTSDTLNETG